MSVVVSRRERISVECQLKLKLESSHHISSRHTLMTSLEPSAHQQGWEAISILRHDHVKDTDFVLINGPGAINRSK